MLEHILNTHLKRHCRAGTTRTCAPQLKKDYAFIEALEYDIATILRDRRPHPRFNQFL